MKKNKMMRLASILLVLVLLTTSVISGTFAKYVTTDSASDTARVAKWGVAVSVNGNLFGTDYATVGATENADSIVATSTNVSSNDPTGNPANIVAPGTENSQGLKIALTGTPEVAYTISAEKAKDAQNAEIIAEEIFLAAGSWGVMVPAHGLNEDTNFENNTYYTRSGTTYTKATAYAANTQYYELIDEVTIDEDYYPITWTVAEVTANSEAFAAISNTRLVDIQTAMITDLTKSTPIDANTDTTGSYQLTWVWPFCQESTDCTTVACNSCKADTILGNLMAENANAVVVKANDNTYATCSSDLTDGTDYNLENKFGISVTVTLVD